MRLRYRNVRVSKFCIRHFTVRIFFILSRMFSPYTQHPDFNCTSLKTATGTFKFEIWFLSLEGAVLISQPALSRVEVCHTKSVCIRRTLQMNACSQTTRLQTLGAKVRIPGIKRYISETEKHVSEGARARLSVEHQHP